MKSRMEFIREYTGRQLAKLPTNKELSLMPFEKQKKYVRIICSYNCTHDPQPPLWIHLYFIAMVLIPFAVIWLRGGP